MKLKALAEAGEKEVKMSRFIGSGMGEWNQNCGSKFSVDAYSGFAVSILCGL